MIDREKVIKGLENCFHYKGHCLDCPYNSPNCQNDVLADAIKLLEEDCHNCKLECLLQKYDELKAKYDLLKEQEQTEPLAQADDTFECICGAIVGWDELDASGIVQIRCNYCPFCGKKVNWNDKQRGNSDSE